MARPTLLAAALILSVSASAQTSEATVQRASRHIQKGDFDKASATLEKLVAKDPEHGAAWYWLGYSRHCLKRYEAAIDANNHAIDLGAMVESSLYNNACAQSLLGKVDDAKKSLSRAVDAGFLDFDQIQSDGDLAAIRKTKKLDLPAMVDWKQVKHRGKVIRYQVLLPDNFDPEVEHEAMLCFGPGAGGPLSGSWTINTFWGGHSPSSKWIILCPIAPDDGKGWINHPAHHALNAVIKTVRKDFKIHGRKLHMFGFLKGCRPATTYARMSKQHIKSLTLMSSSSWSSWSDNEMGAFAKMPPLHFVAAKDQTRREMAERVQKACEAKKVAAHLEVIEGATAALPSLRGEGLLEKIEAHMRRAGHK